MNQQPVEKRISNHDGAVLDLHSVFHTIQGEGPFSGRPATFIRLGGCNLCCPMCDTEYQTRYKLQPLEIMTLVRLYPKATPENLVVITGGEPFRQNLLPLVQLLLADGHTVQVETNGTLPPPNLLFVELCSLDFSERNKCFVVCSPKAGRVNPYLCTIIGAYKYVLSAESISREDGLPIEVLGHSASPQVARPHPEFRGPIYVQPADERRSSLVDRNNRDACAKSAMQFGYTAQVQAHKLFEVQ